MLFRSLNILFPSARGLATFRFTGALRGAEVVGKPRMTANLCWIFVCLVCWFVASLFVWGFKCWIFVIYFVFLFGGLIAPKPAAGSLLNHNIPTVLHSTPARCWPSCSGCLLPCSRGWEERGKRRLCHDSGLELRRCRSCSSMSGR